jgi:murein DD-endopeptidase MepM/ murein hydrolase activator NlpD
MQEEKLNWQKPIIEPHKEEPVSDPNTGSTEPRLNQFFDWLRSYGLGDAALRFATAIVTLFMIVVVVWVMKGFYSDNPQNEPVIPVVANAEAEPTPTIAATPQFNAGGSTTDGVGRDPNLHTILPVDQDRDTVTQYTVELGDSIFSIADKFNLRPQTILWGNRYLLGDDPHFIFPGQKLNILPVDGVYHKWSAGEGLNGVAEFYGVTPEDIIDWPENELDRNTIGDYANPNIPPDKMLVIPGGEGIFSDWRTPRISREEPATAKHLGPGACTAQYDGVSGSLTFLWPSVERYLSGYDYSPDTNHYGIDVAGRLGNPIFAADHGVVVYAGWNDYGYGEMIVIDHGSGWQTLYGHLSQINVVCGQEVYQGDTIGLMGSTGMSTGPHLHFELRSDDYGRVNPWDFLY